jgi:glycosyltransferase involved in cell wall biosynthesis
LHGGFEEGERQQILEELDVLIVPSLGLESFGIAAQEAIAAAVPVLASARGALMELFESPEQGAYFRPGDVQDLRSWVLKLSDRPELIARWAAALPKVKGMDRHAEEIDRIYATLISGTADGR